IVVTSDTTFSSGVFAIVHAIPYSPSAACPSTRPAVMLSRLLYVDHARIDTNTCQLNTTDLRTCCSFGHAYRNGRAIRIAIDRNPAADQFPTTSAQNPNPNSASTTVTIAEVKSRPASNNDSSLNRMSLFSNPSGTLRMPCGIRARHVTITTPNNFGV